MEKKSKNSLLTKFKSFLKSSKSYVISWQVGPEWFECIRGINRQFLLGNTHTTSNNPSIDQNIFKLKPPDHTWKLALNAHGCATCHRLHNKLDDLEALESYFSYHIDQHGNWITPIDRVESAMKGYALLSLVEFTGQKRYSKAAEILANSLIEKHPRTSDGCLPYEPHGEVILVDTLAMICPFLTRYARLFDRHEALRLSINQLKQFINKNLDPDTRLPYHGYYSNGAKRLGLHGWGRGTGWYMMGLIDTLYYMPREHPDYNYLGEAFQNSAFVLQRYQRPDGNWNWAILHKKDHPDTSTTSLVGYSLAQGMQSGVIDDSYKYTVESAILALTRVTNRNGVLSGSLGECLGLGKYPQHYGPSPWLQGSATALAAITINEML